MQFQVTIEDQDGAQRPLTVEAESYERMMESVLAELDEGEVVAGYYVYHSGDPGDEDDSAAA